MLDVGWISGDLSRQIQCACVIQRLLVSEGIYILDEEADKNPVIVLGKYELCTPVALPRSTEFIR